MDLKEFIKTNNREKISDLGILNKYVVGKKLLFGWIFPNKCEADVLFFFRV